MLQLQFEFEMWVDEKYHFGYILGGKRVSLIEANTQNELEALVASHFCKRF